MLNGPHTRPNVMVLDYSGRRRALWLPDPPPPPRAWAWPVLVAAVVLIATQVSARP